ncbi:SOS response-associated peptidase [Fulvivirga sp. RKSG066]|uniref:SOS response-associated peptidase n=1 Tax=Fulvivirga aurantia TaxID=2529383 RepID=UPI0012BCFA20|nr:SOS response-associated peptidase [Fulvivirga aurantia]MTI23039.1 SOS response-associated peptidase [Fulvivirga aurantia]
MGDRFTITADKDKLATRFGVDVTDNYQPKYNAAPTQILPVITQGSKGLSFFYWGQIPDWSKNRSISAKLIYADAASVHTKASTKRLLQSSRCIVPVDGFYDWKKVSKKGKIPHRFVFGDNAIKSFPGIWEEFEDNDGNEFHTFKIITVPANSSVAEMSDTMPAIFDKQQEEVWLSDTKEIEALHDLLQTYPADKMGSYTVSPKFSDTNNEGAHLIEPFAPADQFGNYSLFD